MFQIFRPAVGIIGYGAMGRALAAGISRAYRVTVFDKDAGRRSQAPASMQAQTLPEVFERSNAVIIAIKPQDIDLLLQEVRPLLDGHLVISIAAGIPLSFLEKSLGQQNRLIRVMPNLPAQAGKGISAVCPGGCSTTADRRMSLKIFSCVGKAIAVDEAMMDAVTAVSGSGPGFFFAMIEKLPEKQWAVYARDTFIPQLAAAAIQQGFPSVQSRALARATAEGSLALLKKTGLPPERLRMQVASKGGTTEAGLQVLAAGGLLAEAVKAAAQRSKELSRN